MITRERLVPKCDFSLNEIGMGTSVVQFSPCTVALSLESTFGARISAKHIFNLVLIPEIKLLIQRRKTVWLMNQMIFPNQVAQA